jgi:nucleoside 2-deoxyribosyltransferase
MVFDEKRNERLNAIKLACEEYGFEAFDVENYNVKDNQTIDAKNISAIKSSRFCIADFTGLNQGAYFEGGFAMGRNMKVIFVCDKKDFEKNKKHFDVNHYPFICYNDFDDLTTKLKYEINAYINA